MGLSPSTTKHHVKTGDLHPNSRERRIFTKVLPTSALAEKIDVGTA